MSLHDEVYYAVVLWDLALVGVLAIHTLRAPSIVDRTLSLDMLALVFVAALTTIAVHRQDGGYLDVALGVAMLAFVQTVSVARLVRSRGERP